MNVYPAGYQPRYTSKSFREAAPKRPPPAEVSGGRDAATALAATKKSQLAASIGKAGHAAKAGRAQVKAAHGSSSRSGSKVHARDGLKGVTKKTGVAKKAKVLKP
jgi:hypothetical protein